MRHGVRKWFDPFNFTLFIYGVFVVFAFAADTPAALYGGMQSIIVSRSLLTTDYIAIGGIGASMLNAALTGAISVVVMKLAGAKPNGALLMAVWMNTGFAFFGKNLFNFLPLTLGVWLYSRFKREPFSNYSLIALLSATLSPVVSEFAFKGRFHPAVELLVGTAAGVFVGFFMPIISAATNKVHGGYALYNIGFAGGVLAIFLISFTQSLGFELDTPLYWSTGNNLFLAVFLYTVFALWMLLCLLGENRAAVLPGFKSILGHSGRLVSDYYLLYGYSAYFNMGLLGILGTTVTLALGADLNGPTMAGIFSMMAFGAFGKHPKNCVPVMLGATLMAFINHPDPTDPGNICAILFCTGLAPIAGQYGWAWGIVAGMMHGAIVTYVGAVTGGLNLYNNGFAAGFVALVLVPVILTFKRGVKKA